MSRYPFDRVELGSTDADLDHVARELERYAAEQGEPASLDLVARINAAIAAEPEPRGRWWTVLGAALRPWRGPARVLAVVGVLVAAVMGAIAVGTLAERARDDNLGTSPLPVPSLTPSPTPSISPSPSPAITPSPSPSPTPSPTPQPTASDDDEPETPEPSESDDSSGPGGGGDDSGGGGNSGPGGGGGDNSGPGGGGSG